MFELATVLLMCAFIVLVFGARRLLLAVPVLLFLVISMQLASPQHAEFLYAAHLGWLLLGVVTASALLGLDGPIIDA
jgi:hypothetical protein